MGGKNHSIVRKRQLESFQMEQLVLYFPHHRISRTAPDAMALTTTVTRVVGIDAHRIWRSAVNAKKGS